MYYSIVYMFDEATHLELNLFEPPAEEEEVVPTLMQRYLNKYEYKTSRAVMSSFWDEQEKFGITCSMDGVIVVETYKELKDAVVISEVLIENNQPKSYGGISSCIYHAEENVLGVATPKGVLIYTIDWETKTINSYNTWFNNMYQEQHFDVMYLDSHLIAFYASADEVVYDIRFGSLSLPLKENILSNFRHDYLPICTFNSI